MSSGLIVILCFFTFTLAIMIWFMYGMNCIITKILKDMAEENKRQGTNWSEFKSTFTEHNQQVNSSIEEKYKEFTTYRDDHAALFTAIADQMTKLATNDKNFMKRILGSR